MEIDHRSYNFYNFSCGNLIDYAEVNLMLNLKFQKMNRSFEKERYTLRSDELLWNVNAAFGPPGLPRLSNGL